MGKLGMHSYEWMNIGLFVSEWKHIYNIKTIRTYCMLLLEFSAGAAGSCQMLRQMRPSRIGPSGLIIR
jgi:hypothetical protein